MFFRETFVIFRRQLMLALREPAWIVIGLLQPVLYLVLFGPLLEPLAAAARHHERVHAVRARPARAARGLRRAVRRASG